MIPVRLSFFKTKSQSADQGSGEVNKEEKNDCKCISN